MSGIAECILINDNNPSGARGMARYLASVVEGIISNYGSRAVIYSAYARDYRPAQYIPAPYFKGSEQFSLHHKFATLAAWRVHPLVIYSAWFSHIASPARQVFVVYDLIYELYPQYHSRCQAPLRKLDVERRNSLERADMVIAISQSTARDIATVYPQINPRKIRVIPLAVDPFFFAQPGLSQEDECRPYLLYVGFRTGHKNFMRLLQAYGQASLFRNCDLRVVSRLPFTSDELSCIHRFKMEDHVQIFQNASDTELRQHYKHALALVYPSEYEGFGLPILEAMACGTLVITSNASSMPEVGGDAAIYIDPKSVESIAEALLVAINLNAAERIHRVKLGLDHARSFTWQRCQQQTIAVIEKLLHY